MIRQAAPLIVTRMIPTPGEEKGTRGHLLVYVRSTLCVPLMVVVRKFSPFRVRFMVLGSGRRLFTTNFLGDPRMNAIHLVSPLVECKEGSFCKTVFILRGYCNEEIKVNVSDFYKFYSAGDCDSQ